ncbi:MAG TPA: ATP-grasp domain-containing protein [Gemmataceae bacterium]|nr:ATP-grasp domain-containing protein [Gemmataceae bacterium]
MRIFVYEHLSASRAAGPAAASLLTEGWAMLAALLEDFVRVPGAQVETMLGGAAAGKTPPPGVAVHHADAEDEDATFRRLAAGADWTLIAAPEIDGVLPERIQLVEESHGRLLGPTAAAARLAGDKLRLAERLRDCAVPTPPTALWPVEAPSYPAVCKPRHGAGSQETHLVRDSDELRAVAETVGGFGDDLIVQPYIAGQAASVALLIGPGRRLALPAAAQHLSTDGRFRYLGGRLPLLPDLAERATRLGARAVDAVEGLRGYIGVDMVLGAAADGDGDCVIEINPRLTASYVGLRALARFNLAEAMLAVAAGQAPTAWNWDVGLVEFMPNGRVIRESS